MNMETEDEQAIHNSREAAALLSIKESTLRKYALLLEEAGYKFHKNEFGHRRYFEKDVVALKKLLEIKEFPEMTLKQSATAVMSWMKGDDLSEGKIYGNMTSNNRYNAGYNELYREIQEFKKSHETYNQTLIKRIEEQEQLLMQALKEIPEKVGELLKKY